MYLLNKQGYCRIVGLRCNSQNTPTLKTLKKKLFYYAKGKSQTCMNQMSSFGTYGIGCASEKSKNERIIEEKVISHEVIDMTREYRKRKEEKQKQQAKRKEMSKEQANLRAKMFKSCIREIEDIASKENRSQSASEKASKVLEIMDKKVKPNRLHLPVGIYTLIFHVLCQDHRLKKCLKIYNNMKKDRIKPIAKTINVLLTACANAKVEKLENNNKTETQKLNHMKKSETNDNSSSPDDPLSETENERTFVTPLSYHYAQIAKKLFYLDRKKYEISSSTFMYNEMLRTCLNVNDVAGAYKIYKEIVNKKPYPNIEEDLLHGKKESKKNSNDKKKSIIDDDDDGDDDDDDMVDGYNAILKDQSAEKDAAKIIETNARNGFLNGENQIRTDSNSHLEDKSAPRRRRFIDRIPKPDSFTFSIMLQIFGNNLYKYVKLGQGNEGEVNLFIDLEACFSIFDDMQKEIKENNLKVKMSSHIYNSLMKICLLDFQHQKDQSSINLILELYRRMIKEDGTHPSVHTFALLIQAVRKMEREKQTKKVAQSLVLNVWKEMKIRNITGDEELLNHLCSCLARNGHLDIAMMVYEKEMRQRFTNVHSETFHTLIRQLFRQYKLTTVKNDQPVLAYSSSPPLNWFKTNVEPLLAGMVENNATIDLDRLCVEVLLGDVRLFQFIVALLQYCSTHTSIIHSNVRRKKSRWISLDTMQMMKHRFIAKSKINDFNTITKILS